MNKTKKRKQTKKEKRYFDYSLIAVLIFLAVYGLIMLYSASAYTAGREETSDMFYLKKQLFMTGVGFFVMWVASKVKYHVWGACCWELFWGSAFLVLLVVTPLGVSVNGATRWIKIPGIPQIQPSEIMKVTVILLVSYLLCEMKNKRHRKKCWRNILIVVGISVGMVMELTSNLSTALILLGIVVGMVLVAADWKPRTYISVIGAGIAGIGAFVYLLRQIGEELIVHYLGYRGRRILVWLDPEKYFEEGGYQVLQGLYAVTSGGFWGKGLGNGTQKLGAIPEIQNDYVLAAVMEELGVFGLIIMLVLFGMLLWRLFFIAYNATDIFGSLIVSGILIHIALQVSLNIAVVMAVIPNTGVTLPFFSSGGTATIILLGEIGIALNVSRQIEIKEETN